MKDYYSHMHELKCWPEYYELVRDGKKSFELRKNDRYYTEGDLLVLREWEPNSKKYTGYALCAVVTCVVEGGEWLAPGYVALGIRVLR